MNNNVLFLIAELPAPIIILVLSAMIWKNPPKQGGYVGYRTPRSEKSETAWNYAQRAFGKISTIELAIFTALTVILEIAAITLNFSDDTAFIVCIAHTLALVILLFVTVIIVENGLKKRFDDNGNPISEEENGSGF